MGAEDEVRTRDPQLGRLMLYRLSYFRNLAFFSKGMQRYNILRYALQVVDNFLGFLGRNRRESSEGLSVPLDHFFEHGLGSYPYATFSVHGLIYDHLLKSFRMLCYVNDTIHVALEMSVVLACHIQLSYHVFHRVPEEVLVIEIRKS